jgi:hypothetical protein
MPSQDRKPHPEASFSQPASRAADPMSRTSGRQALWSALIALAIVTIMFVAFYDISVQTDRAQTSASAPATTAPQTTGQGDSQNQGAR